MKKTPKILIFDIETLPNIGTTWGKYEQNVLWFVKEWELASFAYKWLGEKEIYCETRRGEKEDKRLAKKLWKILNEADIVIAHNGDQFDNKKANARFLKFGLKPPHPYQTVDTKKVAKAHFNFNSNSLDDLATYLGVGRKLKHTGKDLWRDCMNGDKKAWALMAKYNKQDVALLERVYMKMLPWMSKHPNVSQIVGKPEGCPKCGGSRMLSRGLRYTRSSSFRLYRCQDCQGYCRARTAEEVPKPRIVNG